MRSLNESLDDYHAVSRTFDGSYDPPTYTRLRKLETTLIKTIAQQHYGTACRVRYGRGDNCYRVFCTRRASESPSLGLALREDPWKQGLLVKVRELGVCGTDERTVGCGAWVVAVPVARL
jgi:hypothetical protein